MWTAAGDSGKTSQPWPRLQKPLRRNGASAATSLTVIILFGRVTFLNCSRVTLSLCGYMHYPNNRDYVNNRQQRSAGFPIQLQPTAGEVGPGMPSRKTGINFRFSTRNKGVKFFTNGRIHMRRVKPLKDCSRFGTAALGHVVAASGAPLFKA